MISILIIYYYIYNFFFLLVKNKNINIYIISNKPNINNIKPLFKIFVINIKLIILP